MGPSFIELTGSIVTSVEIWGQKPSGIYVQAQKIIYVPSTIFLLTSPSETLKETKHQVQSYVNEKAMSTQLRSEDT